MSARSFLLLFEKLGIAISLCLLGCNCGSVNFIGMTKAQVAEKLAAGPRGKDGRFRVLYPLPDSPPNTLVNHFHKAKDDLLSSAAAMQAPQWQAGFHLDGYTWHSYLLSFEDGVVVRQEDRRQPHWTMAEP